jgi:hypothetical protein
MHRFALHRARDKDACRNLVMAGLDPAIHIFR